MGKRHLEAAASKTSIPISVDWQPFFLNHNTPAEGEDLLAHLTKKYGPAAVARFEATDKDLSLRIALSLPDGASVGSTAVVGGLGLHDVDGITMAGIAMAAAEAMAVTTWPACCASAGRSWRNSKLLHAAH